MKTCLESYNGETGRRLIELVNEGSTHICLNIRWQLTIQQ